MRNRIGLSTMAAAPLTLLLLVAGSPAEEAEAQMAVGVQGNWGSEADFGVGARALVNIAGTNLEAVGSADLFFPDNDLDWWDFNANLFYHFHLPDARSVLPYLGGGLNVAHLSANGSSTELGVNLGGGIRFPGNVTPFLEFRAVLSDADQFVVTGGLLFGPTSFR